MKERCRESLSAVAGLQHTPEAQQVVSGIDETASGGDKPEPHRPLKVSEAPHNGRHQHHKYNRLRASHDSQTKTKPCYGVSPGKKSINSDGNAESCEGLTEEVFAVRQRVRTSHRPNGDDGCPSRTCAQLAGDMPQRHCEQTHHEWHQAGCAEALRLCLMTQHNRGQVTESDKRKGSDAEADPVFGEIMAVASQHPVPRRNGE